MDECCGYPMVVIIPAGWKYDKKNPKEFLKFEGAGLLNKNFKYIDDNHEASINSHLGTATNVGSWTRNENNLSRVNRLVEITIDREELRNLRLRSGGDVCRHSGMPGNWIPGI